MISTAQLAINSLWTDVKDITTGLKTTLSLKAGIVHLNNCLYPGKRSMFQQVWNIWCAYTKPTDSNDIGKFSLISAIRYLITRQNRGRRKWRS